MGPARRSHHQLKVQRGIQAAAAVSAILYLINAFESHNPVSVEHLSHDRYIKRRMLVIRQTQMERLIRVFMHHNGDRKSVV